MVSINDPHISILAGQSGPLDSKLTAQPLSHYISLLIVVPRLTDALQTQFQREAVLKLGFVPLSTFPGEVFILEIFEVFFSHSDESFLNCPSDIQNE